MKFPKCPFFRGFTVGPTIAIANSIEILNTFFFDELISVNVKETNRYAKDCLKNDDTTWETNENEIRAFTGFFVLMGIVKLPHFYDYWSTSPLLLFFLWLAE